MIAFRDFRPGAMGFILDFRLIEKNLQATLDEANAWISSESIEVINVETVSPFFYTSLFGRHIRVWYRTSRP
jgi:hypothetical protein